MKISDIIDITIDDDGEYARFKAKRKECEKQIVIKLRECAALARAFNSNGLAAIFESQAHEMELIIDLPFKALHDLVTP